MFLCVKAHLAQVTSFFDYPDKPFWVVTFSPLFLPSNLWIMIPNCGKKLLLILLCVTSVPALGTYLPRQDSLHLIEDFGLQDYKRQGNAVFDRANQDRRIDLGIMKRYDALLAASTFRAGEGEHSMSLPLRVYRGVLQDGTIVQGEKDDQGDWVYLEVRHGRGQPDCFFVRVDECSSGELLVYSSDQVDQDYMNTEALQFELAEIDLDALDSSGRIRGRRLKKKNGKKKGKKEEEEKNALELPESPSLSTEADPAFTYTRGDGVATDCSFFKTVKIAIVYDSDFCQVYGDTEDTQNRIAMTVASASVLYEVDMCVKLVLTNIYSPDSCDSPVSIFSQLTRDLACSNDNSKDTFLKDFRDWSNENRDGIGLDPFATVHAFTGHPRKKIVGCAFVGVVCNKPDVAYGVNYLGPFDLTRQSIIFAHELGHNLAANHISVDDSNGFRYIMQPTLNNPHDGFSQVSIDSILGHLDRGDVTCDGVDFGPGTVLDTPSPTSSPGVLPTIEPTWVGEGSPGNCAVELVDDSPLCGLSEPFTGVDRYVCFPLSTLTSVMPSPPGCFGSKPLSVSVEYETCQSQGSRALSLRNSTESLQPTTSLLRESGGQLRGLADPSEGYLRSISSPACSSSCFRDGSSVCFIAEVDTHSVIFSARYSDRRQVFTRSVEIVSSPSTGMSCQEANAECLS